MNKLYENYYLSAFTFAIGRLAERHKQFATVNQFQQTPLDQYITDLFFNWNGKNFIIEFKKSEEDVRSEYDKPLKKLIIDACSKYQTRFVSINKMFFVCYPNQASMLELIPYGHIMDNKSQGKIRFSLNEFFQYLTTKDSFIGARKQEFKEHFKWLSTIAQQNQKTDEKMLELDVAGLIVSITPQNEVHLLPYYNYNTLELILEIALVSEKSLNKSKSKEKTHSNGYEMG